MMTVREGAELWRDLVDWAPRTGDGHMRNHRVAAALTQGAAELIAEVETYSWSAPGPLELEIDELSESWAPSAPLETAGATEEWSPMAEIVDAGRSGEDWWSERLQAYDAALRWIDAAPRLEDGTPSYAAAGLNTAQQLDVLIAGSQQLHAYRELRIGDTGSFSRRDHMELEQLLAAV
jgi:hypothetical protein